MMKNKSSNLEAGSRNFPTIPTDIIKSVIEEICASIDPKDHLLSSAKSDVVLASTPPARCNGTPRDNSFTVSSVSVEEVCRILGLKNIKIDYSKAEFRITSYNFFQRYVYPILARENPEATRAEVMKLAAAKWCEFCSKNPTLNKQAPLIATQKLKKEITRSTLFAPKRRGRPCKPKPLNATVNEQKIKPTIVNAIDRKDQKRAPTFVTGTIRKFDAADRDDEQALRKSQPVQQLLSTVSSAPSVPLGSTKIIMTNMPRTEEICFTFGLKDVKIDYTKAAPETFKDYVSFNKFVRPKLLKENPLAPMGKVLMLVAAKWREFLNESPPLEAVGESDTIKKLEYNGTNNKLPIRDSKTLNDTYKYRDTCSQNEKDEEEKKFAAPLASETTDCENSDELSGRPSNNRNSKSTVSCLNNSAANQVDGVKTEVTHQDSTSYRSSNDIKPDYSRTSYHSFQKLVRPILVEKNSQSPPKRLPTFRDKIVAEEKCVSQNQTSEQRTIFDTKNEQENVSKPTLIRPSKLKSLGVDKQTEDRSTTCDNRNTDARAVCLSSSTSAPENRCPSSSSVKTEPREKTDCSNNESDDHNENDAGIQFSLSRTGFGFGFIRRSGVGSGVQNRFEKSHAEEQKYFPKAPTNDSDEIEDDDVSPDRNSHFCTIRTCRKRPSESADTKPAIVYSDNIITHSSSSESKNNVTDETTNEDEYDVFGRWVAMKIRKLDSPVLKLQAENEISSVLFQKSAEDTGYPIFAVRGAAVDHSPSVSRANT